jgi:hypothetical protein
MGRGRPQINEDDELLILLYEIKKKYRKITIETMSVAHETEPFRYPSYKTFLRRFGSLKVIKSEDMLNKIKKIGKLYGGII